MMADVSASSDFFSLSDRSGGRRGFFPLSLPDLLELFSQGDNRGSDIQRPVPGDELDDLSSRWLPL